MNPPPKIKQPATGIPAADLIGELVHQFSETLSFYRELIQNSIDAGANRIEVSLEYEKAGRAIVRVEDDGEGMNEQIIDNYLIVLFRSTKENDLTKIGKFGIGFISVFAPKPELVRVHTSRDGESWRLDFHSVKHFDKFKMPQLRDGTLVELFKEMSREQYAELVAESRRTVRYWCRHSETRITFHDRSGGGAPEPVNEPFDLEGGASLRYEEEGTELVMGPCASEPPSYGFYNRGLTLKEGEESFVRSVRFKVKSRYVEHTLTRDNVIRDENFSKAMALVHRLADKELPAKVLEETVGIAGPLSRAAADGDRQCCERLCELWRRRLPYLIALFDRRWTFLRDWDEAKILPSLGGVPVSLKQAKAGIRLAGALYVDECRTPVSAALEAKGIPVLWALEPERLAELLGGPRVATASASFVMPQLLAGASLDPGLSALLARAREADSDSVYRYKRIEAADFAYAGSTINDQLFVIQNEAGQLSPVGERPASTFFFLGRRRRCAVLNAAHPFALRLASLHGARPGLAVYLLLKALHLHDGDVPADKRAKFSALAEKTERGLLEASLKLDAYRGSA